MSNSDVKKPEPTKLKGKNLLKDKKCVVTGGAQGIGRQISYSLAESGADVVILDINETALKEAADYITNEISETKIKTVYRDISDKDKLKESFQEINDYFNGAIDIFINNVGIIHPCRIENIIDDNESKIMDKIININQKGTYYCAAYAYPMLTKGTEPVFIMVGSCASIGSEGQGVYAGSKAALRGLLGTLAKEWKATEDCQAVRAMLIEPDYLEKTAITADENYWINLAKARNTTVEKISSETVAASKVPLKRAAKLSEISETIIYLALSSYLNGEVIVLSGGKTIRV